MRELSLRTMVVLIIIGGAVLFVGVSQGYGFGDTTRPAEAQGHGYVDLDGGEFGDNERVLVKFNDKWWWVNKTTEELELIGDDPK